MGNDGGSIPDRRDLVKNKPKAEQADRNNQIIAEWFYCALSKRDLQEPIVSCELGKLYNKDAILEYLLDKTAYGDGEEICGHVRSLKDVKTLKLTKNPTESLSGDKDTSRRQALFICPLTLKEMSGATPFVYITTCGDVFSASGLRAVSTQAPQPNNATEEGSSSSPPPTGLDLCPQCGTKFDRTTDVRLINPPPEESERLREALRIRRANEPVKTKSKKRKTIEATTSTQSTEAVQEVDAASSKRAKKSSAPTPSTNPAFASVNRKVAAELVEEEKRRKGNMSAAVASLYQTDGKKPAKETFLTMGTFTRYA